MKYVHNHNRNVVTIKETNGSYRLVIEGVEERLQPKGVMTYRELQKALEERYTLIK